MWLRKQQQFIFWSGILGVTLFVVASILGGFQFTNYSPISQYISETMAMGTPYGQALRYFGYIPSGILLTIFAFGAQQTLPKSTLLQMGFGGLILFYGLATVIVGIFPCDIGCNKEFIDPSISQIIHNLTGLLTYMFVPVSIILIGFGLNKDKGYQNLSKTALILGFLSMILVGFLITDPANAYVGLTQRIIEGAFSMFILLCAFALKNSFKKFELSTDESESFFP